MKRMPKEKQSTAYTAADLRVDYAEGNVAHLGVPYTSGWRRMPLHVVGQVVKGRARLDFDDGRHFVIHPGEAFFLRAGSHHKWDKMGNEFLVSRWAHIAVSQGGRGDPLVRLEIPTRIVSKDAETIGILCEELAKFGPGELRIAAAAKKMAMLYELVAVFAAIGEANDDKKGTVERPTPTEVDPDLTRLGPALDVMRQFHFQQLDIADLAEMTHLSVTRFRHVFKRVTGLAPHEYIQRLRFELAKGLLERGDEPVKVIAERVGYEDPYLFSRLFRRHVGITPTAHRHQSRRAP